MKITLLVVGKTTDARLDSLIDEYSARIKHYIPFSIQIIPELKNTKALSEPQQKSAEGELILKAVTANAMMVLLDEHGKQHRSIEFASWIQKKMSSGRDLTFVVGGPYGFSEAVYRRADEKISLSDMTFSHQMIRLLFTEQIYRAMTILKNEPYHHE